MPHLHHQTHKDVQHNLNLRDLAPKFQEDPDLTVKIIIQILILLGVTRTPMVMIHRGTHLQDLVNTHLGEINKINRINIITIISITGITGKTCKEVPNLMHSLMKDTTRSTLLLHIPQLLHLTVLFQKFLADLYYRLLRTSQGLLMQ